MSDDLIDVVVTRTGYLDRVRQPGDRMTVPARLFSASWMQKAEATAEPAAGSTAEGAAAPKKRGRPRKADPAEDAQIAPIADIDDA